MFLEEKNKSPSSSAVTPILSSSVRIERSSSCELEGGKRWGQAEDGEERGGGIGFRVQLRAYNAVRQDKHRPVARSDGMRWRAAWSERESIKKS